MRDYNFGNFICKLRLEMGLSQFQLGKLIGVSDKAVSKWENGSAKPRLDTCHQLASVFHISIDELLACKNTKGTFTMEDTLWEKAYSHLTEIYGTHPPLEILERFEVEKQQLYHSKTLVFLHYCELLHQAGISVEIWGPVSNSFIGWLFGVTRVNPLAPHYYCPNCKSVQFQHTVPDGWDLRDKQCCCGAQMHGEGHHLPPDEFLLYARNSPSYELHLPKQKFKQAKQMLQQSFAPFATIYPLEITDRSAFFKQHKEDYMDFLLFDSHGDMSHNTDQVYLRKTYAELNQKDHCMRISFYDTDQPVSYRPVNPLWFSTEQLRHYIQNEYQGTETKALAAALPRKADLHFSDVLQLLGLECATGAWKDNGEILVKSGISYMDMIAYREDLFWLIQEKMYQRNIYSTAIAFQMMTLCQKGQWYQEKMHASTKMFLEEIGIDAWQIEFLTQIQYLFPKGHMINILCNRLEALHSKT